ncbi:MAG: esterase [Anaerolineaceae bacterium]|nr:esterase [Anaerolineaceae bacterium]
MILPHEHLFTDLRGPALPDYAQADPEAVVQRMSPFLEEAHRVGVTAFVECSTVGVGRNIQILQKLSSATPIHIIAPTGLYRDAYVPSSMRDFTVDQFAQLWIHDLTIGIEDTTTLAGFIKISMSDDGPTPLEKRILAAAAMASKETGAVIASHTSNGDVFNKQIRILENFGLDPSRFIWVHANLEPDNKLHLRAAEKGYYVEFDAIGASWQPQEAMVNSSISLIKAGYEDNILLSHDAGWYQPGHIHGEPEGGYRGFVDLVESFIPTLISKNVPRETIIQITHENPKLAFGLKHKL